MQKRICTMALCLLGIYLLMSCGKQSTDNLVTAEHSSVDSAESLMLTGVDNMQEPESDFHEDQPGIGQMDREEDSAETQEPGVSVYYEKDGKQYEMVLDLISNQYEWASAVTGGEIVKDDHGHERADYNSQDRSFERVDAAEMMAVRRWDNLRYSAGEYLIFEYNGTMHISKYYDLYKPVLSYNVAGTYGLVIKVPGGYMVANDRSYITIFYDEDFKIVKTIEGYRVAENGAYLGDYFQEGLIVVRDMQTGLMGYMDQEGKLAIPCQYGNVSHFSNGYASVLSDAEMIQYTEDAGTVLMFYGRGGTWGIIDVNGNYVLESSEKYANKSVVGSTEENYYVFTMFSPVREDGTVDFVSLERDGAVIETISIDK